MCFAKGLTCGYIPLGGMIIKEEIISAFDNKPLPLGLTYSAHAVACAAANEVLKIYEDENLIDNAARMGTYMEKRIEHLFHEQSYGYRPLKNGHQALKQVKKKNQPLRFLPHL